MKLPTLKNAKLRAWKACSEYIRIRDNYKCFTCDKVLDKYTSDAGHFFNAGHHSFLRFDERNVFCQCTKCNRFEHGNLIEYTRRYIEKFGRKQFEELYSVKNTVKKWTVWELLEIEKYYKQKLEQEATK